MFRMLFQIINIFFIIIPVIALRLFWGYGRFITRGILLVWALFIVVGISSAYFHSTLSLLGQLLDELSILWVCLQYIICFDSTHLFITISLFVGGSMWIWIMDAQRKATKLVSW